MMSTVVVNVGLTAPTVKLLWFIFVDVSVATDDADASAAFILFHY